MNSEHSRLLKWEEEAHEEMRRSSNAAKIAKEEFRRLQEELPPRIEALAHDADEMASKFRRLYQESQDEFSFGNHEFAKELAEQGDKAEKECRRLNHEVRLLRRELDARRAEFRTLDSANKKAERDWKTCISQLRVKNRETDVSGFEHSVIGDDWAAEKFLDSFPQSIFKVVEFVEYCDEPPDVEGTLGYANKNLTDTMMSVRMFKGGNEARLKRAMAEAIGSVVYQIFLSEELRKKWPAERDFRIAFGLFKTDPQQLEYLDEKAYDSIKDIYASLSDEET